MAPKKARNESTSSSSSSDSSGSSDSSSSSSGSSGSSSDSSSSSDTDQSSAVSTRSRSNSQAALSDDSRKPPPSSKKSVPTPSKAPPSYNKGGITKKGAKNAPIGFSSISSNQAQLRSKSRVSSESETELPSSKNKKGPKTSATSVPKSSANSQKVSSSSRSQISHSRKPLTPAKTNSIGSPRKASKDKKLRQGISLENTSDSEIDNHYDKSKHSKHKPLTPRRGQKIKPVSPIKSKIDNKVSKNTPKRPLRKVEMTPDKASESSSNSSSSSSGSESDSSSDSSQSADNKASNKRKAGNQSETDKEDDDEERDEEGSPRRLITRSSSVKTKRSSLLGINRGTDSDSENITKSRSTKKTKEQKPARPLSSLRELDPSDTFTNETMMRGASRGKTKKPIHKIKNDMSANAKLPRIEKRNCPVDGCNSTGHLGGKYDNHFTVEACPIFHNVSKEECKANRIVRAKEKKERIKAVMAYKNTTPTNAEKTERRNYVNKIRDAREKMSEPKSDEEDTADCDRQPSLGGLTPEWDLKLFLAAQAEASEKNENEMRGLPDTKGIRFIQMGHFNMEAWYQSQYPDDYNQQPKIFVCEFCLKYMRSNTVLQRHAQKCVWKHPPGEEIYRRDKISVWEVDGHVYKTYCQNLCLLAMLFLDHKTLYYDVEPFLFYIMTTVDAEGFHIIGYFSKEKNSFLSYNVSCIMTLPPYQRKGYGRLLIDFSYLLTKEEGKIGSPEKPLSDLGLISYRSYWKDLLLEHLSKFKDKNVSIKDLSATTAVSPYDIVSTFQAMGMMKYWKGKHILLKRQDLFEEFAVRYKRRQQADKEIRAEYLRWTPYVPPSPPEESHSNGGSNTNGKSNKSNAKKRPSDGRLSNNDHRMSGNSSQSKGNRPYSHSMTNGE